MRHDAGQDTNFMGLLPKKLVPSCLDGWKFLLFTTKTGEPEKIEVWGAGIPNFSFLKVRLEMVIPVGFFV
jgi:hypothetical protein